MGAKPGRTKGNEQEAEYENRERRHGKPGWDERGRPWKREWKRRTGKATVRRSREVRKGRSRRLSSRRQNGSGRKEAEGKRKIPRARAKGKHLRNSCGKRIREGRKETNRKLSTGTGKESMRNQAGENGEDRRSESESGALRKPL